MCFSPKIKMPKVDTNQIKAPEPAPLTEEVKGVEFGSESEDKDTEGSSSEVKSSSGKSSLKVELNKNKTGSNGAKRMSVKSRMGGKK